MLKKSEAQVKNKATELANTLNNQAYYMYYCKVVYHLSEADIQNNLELALKGKNPARYFTFLCNKLLKEKSYEQKKV